MNSYSTLVNFHTSHPARTHAHTYTHTHTHLSPPPNLPSLIPCLLMPAGFFTVLINVTTRRRLQQHKHILSDEKFMLCAVKKKRPQRRTSVPTRPLSTKLRRERAETHVLHLTIGLNFFSYKCNDLILHSWGFASPRLSLAFKQTA